MQQTMVQLKGIGAVAVWSFVVPLVIWLFCGPWRDKPGARFFGWGWVVLTFLSVPSMLALAEPSLWQTSRPWYLAWAGLVYVVAALATFAWIVVTGRQMADATPSVRRWSARRTVGPQR